MEVMSLIIQTVLNALPVKPLKLTLSGVWDILIIEQVSKWINERVSQQDLIRL
jgi:hypothetical protein